MIFIAEKSEAVEDWYYQRLIKPLIDLSRIIDDKKKKAQAIYDINEIITQLELLKLNVLDGDKL